MRVSSRCVSGDDQAACGRQEVRMHDGAAAGQHDAFDDVVVSGSFGALASLSQNVVRKVSRLRA